MEKILAAVRIPAIEQMFDIWIPDKSLIGEVKILIGAAIEQLSNERYKMDAQAVLCSMDTGNPYPDNITVQEAGIRNGDAIMLI